MIKSLLKEGFLANGADEIVYGSSTDWLGHLWRRLIVSPFELLSSMVSLLVFFLLLILFMPVGYGRTLINNKASQQIWNDLIRQITRWYFYAAGIRLEIDGYHHLQALGQPVIFAANHPSYLDPLVLRIALPDYAGCSVSAPIQSFPWPLSFWFSKVNALEVARTPEEHQRWPNLPKGNQVVEEAVRRLKHGYSILIFPEGHLERIRHPQSFRTGVVRMALVSQRPIVPVTICNSGWVFSPKNLLLRPGTIRIVFRQPLPLPNDATLIDRHEIINLLTNQLLCRIAQDLPASYYTPGMILACQEILSLHPVSRAASASQGKPKRVKKVNKKAPSVG